MVNMCFFSRHRFDADFTSISSQRLSRWDTFIEFPIITLIVFFSIRWHLWLSVLLSLLNNDRNIREHWPHSLHWVSGGWHVWAYNNNLTCFYHKRYWENVGLILNCENFVVETWWIFVIVLEVSFTRAWLLWCQCSRIFWSLFKSDDSTDNHNSYRIKNKTINVMVGNSINVSQHANRCDITHDYEEIAVNI